MAETRRIGGLEIALVAETEQAQRNLDKAKDKVKALESEISRAGVATRDQAKKLDEYSFAVRKAATALDSAESKTAKASSGLTKFKGIIEPTATSISGMASVLGGMGGKAGAVAGAFSNLASVMMAGGVWGAALAAAGLGVGALTSHLMDQKAEAEAAASALREKYVSALEAATKAADDAARAIRDVGKTSTQATINALRAEIAQLEGTAKETTRIHGDLNVKTRKTPQPVSEFSNFASNLATWSNQASAAADGLVQKETKHNDILAEKKRQLENLLKLMKEEKHLADSKVKAEKAVFMGSPTLRADDPYAAVKLGLAGAIQGGAAVAMILNQSAGPLDAYGQSWGNVAEVLAKVREQQEKLAAFMRRVRSEGLITPMMTSGGPMGPAKARSGGAYGRADWEAEDTLARLRSEKAAEQERRAGLTTSLVGAFGNGDVISGAKSLFSSALTYAAGPVGGQIASAITGALEQASQALSAAVQAVMSEANAQAATLLSGSQRASQAFSAMQRGMGSAVGVGGAIAGYGFATAPLAGPFAPLAAGGGLLAGGVVGGGAGFTGMIAEMLTMTDSFQRTSGAFEQAMLPAISALEPFGDKLKMLAPVVGIAAKAMAESAAIFLDQGGMEMLFQGARLAATGIVRLGQGTIMAGMAVQRFNVIVAEVVNMLSTMINEMNKGFLGGALGDTQSVAVANYNALQEAYAMGDDLGDAFAMLQSEADYLTNLTSESATAQGEALASAYERAQGAVDGFAESLQSSTRNMPTFFKVGPAAHASADVEGGPGAVPGSKDFFDKGGNSPFIVVITDDASSTNVDKLISKVDDTMRQRFGSGVMLPSRGSRPGFNR